MSHCSKQIHQGLHVDLQSHHELPFRYVNHLGVGMSAMVNEVEDKTNGQRFAHKIFRPAYGQARERLMQTVREEINIIKRLYSHPHIIELYWSYTRHGTFGMLLTPVASNGDLRAYLHTIRDTQEALTTDQSSVLSRALGCLASGLAFIHSRTIRHKDIKPSNILVHNGKMIYTDFGIALDASGQDTTTTGRPDAWTKRYCAPEVANFEPRNRKSDVFSLGCVFLEILALLAPEFDVGTSDDSPPYWQRVSAIQNNIIHIGNSSTSAGQVFLICRAMLECRSADRVGAEAVLYQVHHLRSSCVEPTYELFCDDCEGPPPIIAQTATNEVAVAVFDTRDASSEGKIDECEGKDVRSQVESSMVPPRLTMDSQPSEDACDETTQERCDFASGFDLENSSNPSNANPPGTLQTVIEHIFPLEIHSRLRNNPFLCVASLVNTPSEQCTVRRPSAPDWISRKFFGYNTDITYSELLNIIGSLVQEVMCATHQNAVLSGPSIVKIQRLVSNQQHLSNKDCSYLRVWSEPFLSKLSEKISVSEALREVIMTPLKARDHIDGFLYILCDGNLSDKVKIGHARQIATQVRQWNKHCKRTYRLSSSLGQLIRIPHSYRVHILILTELREFRVKDECDGCGCTHSDWFAVEEAFAVKVLQKWQNWVAQKPYTPNDVSVEWRLRPEMLNPGLHRVPTSDATFLEGQYRSVGKNWPLGEVGCRV